MVGSMIPSSRFLATKMLKNIPFDQAKVIVELGPGTGIFTEKIMKRLNPDTHLVVIELNDVFYQNLAAKTKQENCHIVHGSASDLDKILSDLGTSALPVGQLLASTGNISLFDDDQAFNDNNTANIISNYVRKNIKFNFYEKILDFCLYD
jgi:phospholipid N-methyltransferase